MRPRLARFVLGFGRPQADAAALCGDLEEEYAERVRRGHAGLRVTTWYWREVLVAAIWAAGDRLRPPGGRSSVERPGRRPWAPLIDGADVRLALRRWRRRPGIVAATVALLALGIGTATAIFSVVDAVVLRPWSWPDPHRLAVVHAVFPGRANDPARAATWNQSPLTWRMWDVLRRSSVFDDLAVWQPEPFPNTTFGEARTEIVSITEVSSNLLPMIGARLLHGRHFAAQDDEEGTRTIMLPYETWQRRFGGRPDIVGTTVMMGSASSGGRSPRTVVGVLAPGLAFPAEATEFYANIGTAARAHRNSDGGRFYALARLRPAASPAATEAAAGSAVESVQSKEPASARLEPLTDHRLGDAGRQLFLLFGGALLLLLVACSNVAGLLLSDAHTRRHEFGVRAALGGRAVRALRQLFVEYSLLAAVGAVAGLVLAWWLTQALVAITPEQLPRVEGVAVDRRMAAFGLSLGAVTLLVFGLAPAWRLARTPALEVLAEGRQHGGTLRHAGQRLLVAVQLALTLVLLVSAVLFGETLLRLTAIPMGFEPSRLALISTQFTGPHFDSQALRAAQIAAQRDPRVDYRAIQNEQLRARGVDRTERVMARIGSLPGVIGVAGTWLGVPFLSNAASRPVRPEGRPVEEQHDAQWQAVTEGYFDVMRMPILAGRNFDASDPDRGPLVAVVSEEFARRVLAGHAVGRRFVRPPGAETVAVVGVVPDVRRAHSFLTDQRPLYYLLGRQVGEAREFIVRTSGDPAHALPAIRRAVADVEPQVVVTSATTMEHLLGRLRANEQFRARLSVCFAGAAFLTVETTRAWLYGVSPTAPHVFALAVAVLTAAALLAAAPPVRRAARLDPARALRE